MVFCNMNVNNLIKLEKAWGHNPYFNRWFSAIKYQEKVIDGIDESQSLF